MARVPEAGSAAIVILSACTAACVTTPPAPPLPPPERTFLVEVPVLAPAAGHTDQQRKGGMTVAVTPSQFTLRPGVVCEYVRAALPFSVLFGDAQKAAGVSRQTHTLLTETRYRVPQLAEDHVTFHVTLANNMQRVFRAAGAVVQVEMGNSVETVDEARYSELSTYMLPPGQQRQFQIPAIPLGRLADGAAAGFRLFDLVTDIDAAGNVRDRQNFEWRYKVRLDRREEVVVGQRSNWWVASDRAAQALGSSRCVRADDWVAEPRSGRDLMIYPRGS
jgi:hypothetical protein